MIQYASTRPGPGFDLGRASMYYAQRVVTAPRARHAVSRAIASAVRWRQGYAVPVPVAPEQDVVDTIRTQGLAMLAGVVSDNGVRQIVEYFRRKQVLGPGNRPMALDQLPPGTMGAVYPLLTILGSRHVRQLINDAAVLRIATHYLGCKPTLSSISVRWSFPGTEPPSATQHFHRDADDWRFLKLFVYLTDVDNQSGPHAYVAHSHLTAGTVRSRLQLRADVERQYGGDKLRVITGPRGTAFIADTYGIHAGMVPIRAPRLILQAQYSLLPVFAFKYDPVAMHTPSLDKYVNRLLIKPVAKP